MTTAAFITFIAAMDARKQRQQAEKERTERQRQQQQKALHRHSTEVRGRPSLSGCTASAVTHHSQAGTRAKPHGTAGRSVHSDKVLKPLSRHSCPGLSRTAEDTADAASSGASSSDQGVPCPRHHHRHHHSHHQHAVGHDAVQQVHRALASGEEANTPLV